MIMVEIELILRSPRAVFSSSHRLERRFVSLAYFRRLPSRCMNRELGWGLRIMNSWVSKAPVILTQLSQLG